MEPMKEWLLRGFDYDLWANLEWFAAKERLQDTTHASEILHHVLAAQLAWHDRIMGYIDANTAKFGTVDLSEGALEQANALWKTVVTRTDLAVQVTSKRSDGLTYTFSVGDIARHVLNHGTYHRGHLRGLADAQALEDFPETDWTAWMRTTGQAGPVEA